MKTKNLIALGMLFVASLAARESAAQNPFTIKLETDGKGYKMTCIKGCSWTKLSWKDRGAATTQVITNNGVGSYEKDFAEALNGNEKFAFKLRKGDQGYEFESISGTAWVSSGIASKGGPVAIQIDESGVEGPIKTQK